MRDYHSLKFQKKRHIMFDPREGGGGYRQWAKSVTPEKDASQDRNYDRVGGGRNSLPNDKDKPVSLLINSLNYHGQQLTSFLRDTSMANSIDMKKVDYHAYQQVNNIFFSLELYLFQIFFLPFKNLFGLES